MREPRGGFALNASVGALQNVEKKNLKRVRSWARPRKFPPPPTKSRHRPTTFSGETVDRQFSRGGEYHASSYAKAVSRLAWKKLRFGVARFAWIMINSSPSERWKTRCR